MIGLRFLYSAIPLKALHQCIKLPSILLEISSRQKCDGRMDGQTDGQKDKAATICSPFGEHKNNPKTSQHYNNIKYSLSSIGRHVSPNDNFTRKDVPFGAV